MSEQPQPIPSQDRMSSEQRRNDLIDITLGLLREGGAEKVTIGRIADQANVTRTLVYKHFANRQDLVNATYRREAAKLHEAIRSQVDQTQDFEARLRAFVNAVLGAVDTHGWIFGPQEALPQEAGFRKEQNQRDRRTVRNYAQLVSEEFGLSLREATSAMGILLGGITSLRIQASVLKTPKDRQFLSDLYIDFAMGAISGLRDRRKEKH